MRHLKSWVGGSRAKSNLWGDESTKLKATNIDNIRKSSNSSVRIKTELFLDDHVA